MHMSALRGALCTLTVGSKLRIVRCFVVLLCRCCVAVLLCCCELAVCGAFVEFLRCYCVFDVVWVTELLVERLETREGVTGKGSGKQGKGYTL